MIETGGICDCNLEIIAGPQLCDVYWWVDIMVNVTYARIGAAQPCYAISGVLFGRVSDVFLAYAHHSVAKRAMIKACADARDVGVGHFIYKLVGVKK